ncbi:MAG: DUF6787 family protein [Bacteroidota bacterium]
MKWIEKLKDRWEVKSVWQVLIILVVFACTGFSVLFLKEPLYRLAGITSETSAWIRVPFYLLTILPAYQILLLGYGFIFGQFRFFWNFEKKVLDRFRKLGELIKK